MVTTCPRLMDNMDVDLCCYIGGVPARYILCRNRGSLKDN